MACGVRCQAVSESSDNTSGGNPSYTIEVSNDGTTFTEYDSNSTGVDLEDAFADDIMPFAFMRIVFDSPAPTTGTVTFNAVFK